MSRASKVTHHTFPIVFFEKVYRNVRSEVRFPWHRLRCCTLNAPSDRLPFRYAFPQLRHDLPGQPIHGPVIDLQQKRETARANRHHKWKSLATRQFRKKHQALKKSSLTFEKFSPIGDLWDEYAKRLPDSEQSVSKMDLHGAKITITASRDPNLIGVSGRVVKESYGALVVISEDSSVRQINKSHTVAEIETPNGRYELNLTALRIRPSMKIMKKWKQRSAVPLPY
jgi:RNase P/RNase MRP subunit p29